MQEVFARFIKRSKTEAIANPKAFLYTIADNVLKEAIHRRKTSRVTFDSDAMANAATHPSSIPRNDILNPISAEQAIVNALRGLPPLWQECVLLHERDDLNFEEIGKRLGISLHTAKKYTTLALAQILKKTLE
jgi:RNA polymerase sigma-70 factor (ECF subfamily)